MKNPGRPSRADLSKEYSGAKLGDRRLGARLKKLAERAARNPQASFPKATGSIAELEAAYRFLGNKKVTCSAILAPHVRETARRVGDGANVVVAHDTTEFNFGSTSRKDLGRVGRGKSFGFYGHFALAVRSDELRFPLGVLGLRIHRRHGGLGRRGHRKLADDPNNEGLRWLKLVEDVEGSLDSAVKPIHAMDREGDAYGLLAGLQQRGSRFVVRMAQDTRPITGGAEGRVREALARATVVAEREVPITERKPSKLPANRKHFPPRKARTARLHVTSETVTLLRPDSAPRDSPRELTLNVVRVFEPEPPEGEERIEWRLWTSEPVATAAEALAVVDAYRCRWRIEEYFKALKTGCAIQQRQLETFRGLANALCLYVPIAWRLLILRSVARERASEPAETVLTPTQIICLRAALREDKRPPLPERPTARDALLGVAALGGHLPNNGDPGWLVLARGMDSLLDIDRGYVIATKLRKCDQS